MEGTGGGAAEAAEARPLRNEEEAPKAAAEGAAAAAGAGAAGGRRRRSRWRTAAFFLSLFLCLAAVFAFSFAVPCPVRPRSERAWSRAYDRAGECGEGRRALAPRPASLWGTEEGGPGLVTPPAICNEVYRFNGVRRYTEDVLLDRTLPLRIIHKISSAASTLQHLGTLQASLPPTAAFPFLEVADADKDSVQDVLFAFRAAAAAAAVAAGTGGRNSGNHSKASCAEAGEREEQPRGMGHGAWGCQAMALGTELPPTLPPPSPGLSSPCAFMAAHAGTNGSTLWVRPVAEDLQLVDCAWEHDGDPACLLLGKPGLLAALDLETGQTLWQQATNFTANSTVLSPLLKVPSINKDEVLDLLVFTEAGKEVTVVEGTSGDIKWEVELLHPGSGSPRPATLPTADHRSVFLFWGRYQENTNGTGSPDEALQLQEQYLYLFHPSLPNVLLEMSNSTEAIVAFEGVLFERSRHACYVLLTGPQASGTSNGRVVLTKQKLKEDMAGGRVVWLSQVAQDTEQNVRERLLRMRYRSLP
ncbi:hypothetical protein JD844_020164 [Phrynosoma platyrhinos]|uniref:FAM234A/B beta-propeller domain-containing protein n=1 Tax=Phrynosoma platyrhinos TaxID=52577 RepID=A0ABQ7TRB3_PHRPL|nr:hypothetical protein JD844_020164 [Phrynosoma platyrhinos]